MVAEPLRVRDWHERRCETEAESDVMNALFRLTLDTVWKFQDCKLYKYDFKYVFVSSCLHYCNSRLFGISDSLL